MIFFDTETVGLTGPLVTIQYWHKSITELFDQEPTQNNVTIHYVWKETVRYTLNLIESFAGYSEGIVGFNLVFDWFQLTKWYNILRRVKNKDEPPNVKEIQQLEAEGPQSDDYCLRPARACDVMLLAKSGKFQYLARHKPILIRKVPVQILQSTIDTLTQLTSSIEELPGIKIRWRVSEKRNYQRKDVKDIIGEFTSLSAKLKHLASIILDDPEIATKDYEHEVGFPPCHDAPDYKPWGGDWIYGLSFVDNALHYNPKAIQYAINDVIYTYKLWKYLGSPKGGDCDSELACLVGASHWKGFALASLEILNKRLKEYQEDLKLIPVPPSAHSQVLSYLHSFCQNDLERGCIKDTTKATREELGRWEDHPIKEAVTRVGKAKKAEKRIDLLKKLISAGRFCFSMKILGALSSRMSGGQEESGRKGELNAQGIPRESSFRSLFPLSYSDERLEGGDFSAFEPTILDAAIGDEQFRKDLISDLKIYLFTGSEFYQTTPKELMKTKGNIENDKYYSSKQGFLAWLYGAQQEKIAQVMDLPEKDIENGFSRIFKRWPRIKIHRDDLQERFTPIRQLKGVGTEIEWTEPDEYIDSLLGYRRYFTLEWSIIRILYNLAHQPPSEWKNISGECRRTNRSQTIVGATQSALYGAIFSLQGYVFRAAANHEIQSTGAQLTKLLQCKIWDLQPIGINLWIVRPLNIHDEIMCPTTCQPGVIKSQVDQFIGKYREKIPLLDIEWNENLKSWGDK